MRMRKKVTILRTRIPKRMETPNMNQITPKIMTTTPDLKMTMVKIVTTKIMTTTPDLKMTKIMTTTTRTEMRLIAVRLELNKRTIKRMCVADGQYALMRQKTLKTR